MENTQRPTIARLAPPPKAPKAPKSPDVQRFERWEREQELRMQIQRARKYGA